MCRWTDCADTSVALRTIFFKLLWGWSENCLQRICSRHAHFRSHERTKVSNFQDQWGASTWSQRIYRNLINHLKRNCVFYMSRYAYGGLRTREREQDFPLITGRLIRKQNICSCFYFVMEYPGLERFCKSLDCCFRNTYIKEAQMSPWTYFLLKSYNLFYCSCSLTL